MAFTLVSGEDEVEKFIQDTHGGGCDISSRLGVFLKVDVVVVVCSSWGNS